MCIRDRLKTNVELCVGGGVTVAGAKTVNKKLAKLPFDLSLPQLKFCNILGLVEGWLALHQAAAGRLAGEIHILDRLDGFQFIGEGDGKHRQMCIRDRVTT